MAVQFEQRQLLLPLFYQMESLCEHVNDNHITWSLQGRLIYKDQCTRCFVEAKSDTGIAICLKCFNGGCLQKHSVEHATHHDHQIVLNLRLFEVEQPPQKPEEINKLVIADIPQLESHSSVACLKCKVELRSEKIDGLVQSIKLADSAFKRAAITAWEHVAQPCEHTLTLQQLPLIEKNLLKCRNCELSANLWLCLTCGQVGCGRKNYDGSGGNNHAIDHNKVTGHCVVVKLGTITPEGGADIYCYACDDEVVDSFLKEHLSSFGIEVEKQTKTEKTMAELNLDANLALQLSKLFEEGKVLDPVFGPGLTGIDNIGNSCYMNSVVQVIFSMEEFQRVYAIDHQLKCKRIPYSCSLCQISKVNYGLNSGDFSIKKVVKSPLDVEGAQKDYYQDGIRLYDFKQLVAKGNNEFLSNRQQDALEYWQILLNYFQKLEKSDKLDPLSTLFTYEQSSIMQCTACKGYKTNVQKNQEFKLPCEHPTPAQVQAYQQQEFQKYEEKVRNLGPGEEAKPFKLDDLPEYDTTFEFGLQQLKDGEAVQMHCPRCAALQVFIKREYFLSFPKYLFVPVNRFFLENWVPKKLNANIHVQQQYDFSDFRAPHLNENEKLNEQKQNQYDENALSVLTDLGFSKNRCIRALIKAKNNVEQASMFLMESIEDPSWDDPIQPEGGKGEKNVNEEFVEQIMAMGFSKQAAVFALRATDNNLERAADYVFNHDVEQEAAQQISEAQAQPEQKQQGFANDSSKYELYATIVHLGKSVHCGHYVSYIKKNGEWFLFNDSKVAKTPDPALHKGYIYIFRRL